MTQNMSSTKPSWNRRKGMDRDTYLQVTYGITHKQYLSMYAKQKAKCALCDKPPDGWPGLVVDHCHTTGKVRGLLCTKCNIGLGFFKDNKEALAKAVLYLQA